MILNGINYRVEVSGSGETLLLLHGFTGSTASWHNHITEFNKRFQVVAVDLLGHGKTESPLEPQRYQMQYAAADLGAMLTILGIDTAHVLGYSMGGRLALYFGLHYPQRCRSLILESSLPGLSDEGARLERRAQDNALANFIDQSGIEAFVDYWQNVPLFASQSSAQKAQLRAERLKCNPVGLANSLRGMGTGVQPSLWTALPKLAIPTLLIAGELDAKFTAIAQQMRDLILNSRLQVVRSAGHTPHLETPVDFRNCITAFILRGT